MRAGFFALGLTTGAAARFLLVATFGFVEAATGAGLRTDFGLAADADAAGFLVVFALTDDDFAATGAGFAAMGAGFAFADF